MRVLLQPWPVLLGLLLVIQVAAADKPQGVADAEALVDGTAQLGANLYGTQRDAAGNLCCSPYSLTVGLAMTSTGAGGNTLAQMNRVLHVDLPPERLARACRAIAPPAQVKLANGLFAQHGYRFLRPFLELLRNEFGAPVRQVGFIDTPESARLAINRWVSRQTAGRIGELVPEGSVSPTTRLVLINAVHFQAAWADPFDPRRTADEPFTLLSGKAITCRMMHRTETSGYAQGDGWEAVELPYVGKRLSMVLIAPTRERFAAYEQGLTGATLHDLFAQLKARDVALSLPRFALTARLPATAALQRLGMIEPFVNGVADFSGMTGNRALFVNQVLHQAFLKVDEAGTEAAAVSSVLMDTLSAHFDPVKVRLDHPFLFAIRDRANGLVLFLGRVTEPRG